MNDSVFGRDIWRNFLGLIATGVCICLGIMGAFRIPTLDAIESRGQVTPGFVSGSLAGRSEIVYLVEGRPYRIRASIPPAATGVSVHYLPDSPSDAYVDIGSSRRRAWFFTVLGALGLALHIVLRVRIHRRQRLQSAPL
ncbi:hypothetical protein EON81_22830 [bacterium]|nr:MAG: hypothetical protein EON81_22830 [bacterium]